MATNYSKADNLYGSIDLDDEFINEPWLVDQFVGNYLFSWGGNSQGQAGRGVGLTYYSSPVQVGSLTNWKQVACGYFATAGIKTDGTLWTWGWNDRGQLGINNNGVVIAYYSSPVQVGSLTNWKQVACGFKMTAAVTTDGRLYVWGECSYGQAGNGTRNNFSSPVQVGAFSTWRQVSCGIYSVHAIKTDGTLWNWGKNTLGSLGNGTGVYYSSPIQIGSLTDWQQVSAGAPHVLAIKKDGTLWAWGQNNSGSLGNLTSTRHYSSPIQIGSMTDWRQVSGGVQHSMAIKTNGTLWGWGTQSVLSAALGNNTTASYSSPIQIGFLQNWKQVSAGAGFTAAVKTDGTLWVWGGNLRGQVGNNTNQSATSYSSPVQIGSLTSWKSATASWVNSTFGINFKDIG